MSGPGKMGQRWGPIIVDGGSLSMDVIGRPCPCLSKWDPEMVAIPKCQMIVDNNVT